MDRYCLKRCVYPVQLDVVYNTFALEWQVGHGHCLFTAFEQGSAAYYDDRIYKDRVCLHKFIARVHVHVQLVVLQLHWLQTVE